MIIEGLGSSINLPFPSPEDEDYLPSTLSSLTAKIQAPYYHLFSFMDQQEFSTGSDELCAPTLNQRRLCLNTFRILRPLIKHMHD